MHDSAPGYLYIFYVFQFSVFVAFMIVSLTLRSSLELLSFMKRLEFGQTHTLICTGIPTQLQCKVLINLKAVKSHGADGNALFLWLENI